MYSGAKLEPSAARKFYHLCDVSPV